MPLSGEAIRLMNYVDDVSTTLRREYLSKSEPSIQSVVTKLTEAKTA